MSSYLIDFPDGSDLLVLGVGADGLHGLKEVDVVVPDAERQNVQTHFVQREVVSLSHLFSETKKILGGKIQLN